MRYFWVSERYGYRYDVDIMIPSQNWYGYDIILKFCQRFDMIFISNDLGYLISDTDYNVVKWQLFEQNEPFLIHEIECNRNTHNIVYNTVTIQ